MAANGMHQTPVESLRLNENITELTAIARIKPGMYPEARLTNELEYQRTRLEQGGIKLWLSQDIPGKAPRKTWLEHLQDRDKKGKPLHMTYLDHFRAVLGWAHEARQDAIRKMVTIHYARWVILEQDLLPGIDGPHVLFTSNFDGKLEEYLEDFAAIDEFPLNLIFGHCVGWPGARPVEGFIDYVKRHQLPAGLFYANYPSATVHEVNRALDWKHKTTCFIQKVVPELKGKATTDWAKATSDFMKDLAKPTPRDREAAGREELLKMARKAAKAAPKPVETSIRTRPPDSSLYVSFARNLKPNQSASSEAAFRKTEVSAVPYPKDTRARFTAALREAIARLFHEQR